MDNTYSSIKDEFILEKGFSSPDLFGENDVYLHYIEKILQLKIFFRGNHFVINAHSHDNLNIGKKAIFFLYNKACVKKQASLKQLQDFIEADHIEKNTCSLYEKKLMVNQQKSVILKNEKQQEFINMLKKNTICFGVGAAGTGKTYLAIAYALSLLYAKKINKIILTRPVIEAGENLGFLPGTLEEKIAPYLKPLFEALESFVEENELAQFIQKNIIEIVPLAYMRGRSLNNAVILLDEAQNTSFLQIKMFLTRLGKNSVTIITGDPSQKDLPWKTPSGLNIALEILKEIEEVGVTYFEKQHSVRHPLVKKVIQLFENYEKNQKEERGIYHELLRNKHT